MRRSGSDKASVGGSLILFADLLLSSSSPKKKQPPPRPPNQNTRRLARRHGRPRLLQGRGRGARRGPPARLVLGRAPRPRLARLGPRVRRRVPRLGPPPRRARRQRGGLPAHGQGAALHGRRVRALRGHQPPRPLPALQADARGPRGLAPRRGGQGGGQAEDGDRRVHHREHQHAGGERAAQG